MTATEGGQDLLAGIRVVDFSQFYAGPVCGRILAEMGAEVILLEQAGRIDPTRHMTTIGGVDFSTPQGRNLLFDAVSRGKKSVCIDLKTDKGRQAVHRLVKSFSHELPAQHPGCRWTGLPNPFAHQPADNVLPGFRLRSKRTTEGRGGL